MIICYNLGCALIVANVSVRMRLVININAGLTHLVAMKITAPTISPIG